MKIRIFFLLFFANFYAEIWLTIQRLERVFYHLSLVNCWDLYYKIFLHILVDILPLESGSMESIRIFPWIRSREVKMLRIQRILSTDFFCWDEGCKVLLWIGMIMFKWRSTLKYGDGPFNSALSKLSPDQGW